MPGGVHSADDVRDAIARDPIVAVHYARVNTAALRAVTLTTGRAAYVSYRVGGLVYWTRRRVWIKAGETVLTDGAVQIRTRCGNCISATQQQPTADVEPAAGVLDDAVLPLPDRGVDAFAADTAPDLADLLGVPFGALGFASLAPAVVAAPPSLGDSGEGAFPFWAAPLAFPGVGGGGSRRRDSGPAPASFVPVDDSPVGPVDTTSTSGTPTTGSGTTGAPTTGAVTTGFPTTGGSPGDVTTTSGVPGDTTTGFPTNGTPTTGFATTGAATTASPTSTSGGDTLTTSAATGSVPEPGSLSLLLAGLAALAHARRR